MTEMSKRSPREVRSVIRGHTLSSGLRFDRWPPDSSVKEVGVGWAEGLAVEGALAPF